MGHREEETGWYSKWKYQRGAYLSFSPYFDSPPCQATHCQYKIRIKRERDRGGKLTRPAQRQPYSVPPYTYKWSTQYAPLRNESAMCANKRNGLQRGKRKFCSVHMEKLAWQGVHGKRSMTMRKEKKKRQFLTSSFVSNRVYDHACM